MSGGVGAGYSLEKLVDVSHVNDYDENGSRGGGNRTSGSLMASGLYGENAVVNM